MSETPSDTVSEEPASTVGWGPGRHIDEACREVDRFMADLHPRHLDLAQAHALIAQAKKAVRI